MGRHRFPSCSRNNSKERIDPADRSLKSQHLAPDESAKWSQDPRTQDVAASRDAADLYPYKDTEEKTR